MQAASCCSNVKRPPSFFISSFLVFSATFSPIYCCLLKGLLHSWFALQAVVGCTKSKNYLITFSCFITSLLFVYSLRRRSSVNKPTQQLVGKRWLELETNRQTFSNRCLGIGHEESYVSPQYMQQGKKCHVFGFFKKNNYCLDVLLVSNVKNSIWE